MDYNLHPEKVFKTYEDAVQGNDDVPRLLSSKISDLVTEKPVVVFECYPCVNTDELIETIIKPLAPAHIVLADDFGLSAEAMNQKIADSVTDDRVFGRLSQYQMVEFFPDLALAQAKVAELSGLTIVVGTGASLIAPQSDLLIYCDLARWEIQLRYRKGLANWRQDNPNEDQLRKVKRGYFVDWRIADRLKAQLLPTIDYLLDTNVANEPKIIDGPSFRAALTEYTAAPYRTVPYFDASVWGGQWMKENYGLPTDVPNYGWAFDGVPEENSLYLRFGDVRIEIPAQDLMLSVPKGVLGERVYARFGAEFPIRFDYLDTVEGGNLSLQVHPLTNFIHEHYGMAYTQDESYYILHAEKGASVYLGTKNGIDQEAMTKDFKLAERGEKRFPDEQYINKLPAKTGDHFLIPAGTIHCGGAGTVILEISATPYIFTFKMWDWGRIGLDGKPRPLHVDEGLENLQLERDTDWVKERLVNHFEPVSADDTETVERTGLDSELEFIETRRHHIHATAHLSTFSSVNMLNVVDGSGATISSPTQQFEDFTVHFGETFIVPANASNYDVSPLVTGETITLMQAFVK